MSEKAAAIAIGCGCAFLMFIVVVILIGCSVHTLEPLEFGIEMNKNTKTLLEDKVSQGGRHWLGLGHTYIRFPANRMILAYTDWSQIGTPQPDCVEEPEEEEVELQCADGLLRDQDEIARRFVIKHKQIATRSKDGLKITVHGSMTFSLGSCRLSPAEVGLSDSETAISGQALVALSTRLMGIDLLANSSTAQEIKINPDIDDNNDNALDLNEWNRYCLGSFHACPYGEGDADDQYRAPKLSDAQKQSLVRLYRIAGEEGWRDVISRIAEATIRDGVSKHDANMFYLQRSKISKMIEGELRCILSTSEITVYDFDLLSVWYPPDFQTAIQETQIANQTIAQENYRRTTENIQAQTNKLVNTLKAATLNTTANETALREKVVKEYQAKIIEYEIAAQGEALKAAADVLGYTTGKQNEDLLKFAWLMSLMNTESSMLTFEAPVPVNLTWQANTEL
jgi:hypothetical protein